MSPSEAKDKIRQIQRILEVKDDGDFGVNSKLALSNLDNISRQLPQPSIVTPPPGSGETPVDPRSEKAIATLHPRVQPIARQFVKLTAANGIKVEITSGTRSYAEQQALFDKHDGTTRAPAGYSNHNFGLAFDVTMDAEPDDTLQPVWESPLYKKLGVLGKSLGLTWGGDWQSIVDEPHFEVRPPWAKDLSETSMISELRRRHAAGIDAFA
jgi:peptidoglycan L-alanyl-D-glutamate endopeptidase CwlK